MKWNVGETVYFPCNKWLDKEKGDKLIERDLVPGEKPDELRDEYVDDDVLNSKIPIEADKSYPGNALLKMRCTYRSF